MASSGGFNRSGTLLLLDSSSILITSHPQEGLGKIPKCL